MGGFSGLHNWGSEMLFGGEVLQAPTPEVQSTDPSRYSIVAAVVLCLGEAQMTEMFVR